MWLLLRACAAYTTCIIFGNSPEHFHVNPEEISQALQNATSIEFPENSPQDNTITVKKEPLLNFAQAKYKETDGKSTRVFECEICKSQPCLILFLYALIKIIF